MTQQEIPQQDITPTDNEKPQLDWKSVRPMLPVVDLNDSKQHSLEFLNNEPYVFTKTKLFNNKPKEITTFMFSVREANETKTFFVSNNKLLRQLKTHDPLQNKVLNVTRTGKGMDTKYTVTK